MGLVFHSQARVMHVLLVRHLSHHCSSYYICLFSKQKVSKVNSTVGIGAKPSYFDKIGPIGLKPTLVGKSWFATPIVTCKLELAVELDFFQLHVHSVIPYFHWLHTDVYFENFITKSAVSDIRLFIAQQWLRLLKFKQNCFEKHYLVSVPLNNRVKVSTKRTWLSAGTDSLFLQFRPTIWTLTYSTYALQTHQLHYLASRTSFSDTVTSYRQTTVLLKLSNFTFCRIFQFTRHTLTEWLRYNLWHLFIENISLTNKQ